MTSTVEKNRASTPPTPANEPPATVNPPERPPADALNRALLRKLLPYLISDNPVLRLRIGLSLLCLLLAKLCGILTPYISKNLIDAFTVEPENGLLVLPLGLILAYSGARISVSLFEQLREILFARVGRTAVHAIALDSFKHLHHLSLRFHLERQLGALGRIIDRGSKGMWEVLSYTMLNVFPTLLEVTLVTIFLWVAVSFQYAMVVLLTVAAYATFTLSVTEWRIKYRRAMNKKDDEANTKAIDSLLNYETVKYFNNEQHEFDRYDRSLTAFSNAAVKAITTLSLVNFGQASIISTGMLVISLMAAHEIVAGTMTIGDFVMLSWFMIQLYMPLNFLGYVYHTIKQALVDMVAMLEMMEIDQEITDHPTACPLPVSDQYTIRFADVRFHYNPDRPILKGISFDVPSGKTIAVVGHSGAGKSTLSRLLFRFYDYTGGDILINDRPITDYTQESLRKAIGIVPQDTVLFNDTIAYNIRYGRISATHDEVIAAARQAQIHDFIQRLPQGFDTMVGERGLKLSGGEKQRVVIARTILKNPGILVLDEATSALDTATERQIQQTLDSLSVGRTVMIIAHRLSTVVHADQIVVLAEGEVIETGTHEELLARGGHYQEMWQNQIDRKSGDEPE